MGYPVAIVVCKLLSLLNKKRGTKEESTQKLVLSFVES